MIFQKKINAIKDIYTSIAFISFYFNMSFVLKFTYFNNV